MTLLGAGCANTTSIKTTTTAHGSDQSATEPASSTEPAPADSEDINVMIKAAQQEDQTEMDKEKKDNDAEVQEAQKSSIETKESTGISF